MENLTLGQLWHLIQGNFWTVIVPWIITADTVLMNAFKELGWIKAETFCVQFLKLLFAIVKSAGKASMPAKTGAMILFAFFLTCPSWSWAARAPQQTTIINNTQINPTAVVVTEKNIFGPMVSAPKLVHIWGGWYLGAEGYKDEAYTSPSRGWAGFAVVTYEGTLLDFSKPKGD